MAISRIIRATIPTTIVSILPTTTHKTPHHKATMPPKSQVLVVGQYPPPNIAHYNLIIHPQPNNNPTNDDGGGRGLEVNVGEGSPFGEVMNKHKHEPYHRAQWIKVVFCIQPTRSQWSCKENGKHLQCSLEPHISIGIQVVRWCSIGVQAKPK